MQSDFNIENLINTFDLPIKVIGNYSNIHIDNVKPILEADEHSICWINPKKVEKHKYINETKSKFIICDEKTASEHLDDLGKCFLVVEDPKLVYLRIIEKYFVPKFEYCVHPKSDIHKDAKISENVFIGAFTYIGNSEIGEGTKIFGNCYIYDNVKIGKNVTIHAGTVIGSDGFGYQRNADGNLEKFPHVGGVIIEDNVEIGANTCIDKGTLGNTIIKQGAKIDNQVHIAHNVVVGKDSLVIANSMIGGSTIIGDRAWVAPSVAVMNGIEIGEDSTIGLGAVVVKTVPPKEVYIGNPAKPIKEYSALQMKLRKLK